MPPDKVAAWMLTSTRFEPQAMNEKGEQALGPHGLIKGQTFGAATGLDPVTQYRRYIQVTDCFSLNSVGGK